MTELWRPIAGFPAYEVSDHGRVRSLDRTISFTTSGRGKTCFLRGKLLTITVGSHGYGQVSLSDQAVRTEACVHVLVAAAFIGPRPDGLNVLHDDGDQSNCCASNLYYGNQVNNLDDAKRHGTLAVGERNGQAKLTIVQVRTIRRARGSYQAIGTRFGVSSSNIGMIKRGVSWAGQP